MNRVESKPVRGKLTPEARDRVVEAVRAGNFPAVAARYAGISPRTLRRWMARGRREPKGRYREFHDAVRHAESLAEIRAVAMLQKQMQGNWRAALTFLERKFPSRWGKRDRTRVELATARPMVRAAIVDPPRLTEIVRLLADSGALEDAPDLDSGR